MWTPRRTISRPPCNGQRARGGVARRAGRPALRPQKCSRKSTKPTALSPNRWPRSASEAVRSHSGPVTPAGHGMSGGAGISSSERGFRGVEAGTVCRVSLAWTGLSPRSRL